jgi:hypothetical protein
MERVFKEDTDRSSQSARCVRVRPLPPANSFFRPNHLQTLFTKSTTNTKKHQKTSIGMKHDNSDSILDIGYATITKSRSIRKQRTFSHVPSQTTSLLQFITHFVHLREIQSIPVQHHLILTTRIPQFMIPAV